MSAAAFALSSAQHVMVTGAAGAIGGALARTLHARAPMAHFTLVDNDARGVEGLAAAIGARAHAAIWDLSKPDALPEAYADATRGRSVDVLLNCAGIMELLTFSGTPWALGQKLLDIDLVSPMHLMSLAMPGMRARGAGLIVNLASLAGVLPVRGSSFYGAAKAGLAAASEIARIELAPQGIAVLTVYPGPVASGLERHARSQVPSTPITRWLPLGDASALAQRIVSAVNAREPRVVYPTVYVAAARALGIARAVTERFSPQPLQ
jgi:short-subunit dehydrogenase